MPGDEQTDRDERLFEYQAFHDHPILALEDGACLRLSPGLLEVVSGSVWKFSGGMKENSQPCAGCQILAWKLQPPELQGSMDSTSLPPDQLNSVGVLVRREIEARLLIPLLQSLEEQFGREQVRQVLREVILKIARQQGVQIAQSAGTTLAHFAASLDAWQKGAAMQIEKLEQSERRFKL